MRNLDPRFKAFLDSRILITGALLDPRQLLVACAYACIGVEEEGGDNRGPLVEAMQAAVKGQPGDPWCIDFMQACIGYVEHLQGIQSSLPPTASAVDLWMRGKNYYATQAPQTGDLILWRHRGSQAGHGGILVGSDSLTYETIEGNTTDSSALVREGNGVYLKKRARGGTQTFEELGFLRAFDDRRLG